MPLVRVLDVDASGDTTGLGDFNFDILPRKGETIVLSQRETVEVVGVEHHFFDATKVPEIRMVVRFVTK
ncbi:MAG: hypothetical protein GEU87_10630 [Alphaproteobacteria bacterium]|nr:hypothetical protein [Alphaproteobacteria bacterium]